MMTFTHSDDGSGSESQLDLDLSLGLDFDAVIIDHADFDDFNPGNILPESTGVLADITKWLDPTIYSDEGSEYQKHLSFHFPGTGEWVFSASAYHDWYSGPGPGILWIRGR